MSNSNLQKNYLMVRMREKDIGNKLWFLTGILTLKSHAVQRAPRAFCGFFVLLFVVVVILTVNAITII